MSNQALLAPHLLTLFAYFVEENTVVESQTITSLVKPDNTPTDNWPSLGTVLPDSEFGFEETDDSYMAPQPSGGYLKMEDKWVIGDTLKFMTREQCELFHRLTLGFASPVVTGVAQSPSMLKNRRIRGWLHGQFRRLGGSDLIMVDWWCDLRAAPLKIGDKVAGVTWTARKLGNVPGASGIVLP